MNAIYRDYSELRSDADYALCAIAVLGSVAPFGPEGTPDQNFNQTQALPIKVLVEKTRTFLYLGLDF